ncbi:protoheme IX farnesyltransferase [Candidatus Bathyarchaeota archaeon]|nr:protoheme IX farnesyltransferase [Candidatus Bathyarchaeota archaeon]
MGSTADYWRLTKPRVTVAIFLLFILAVLAGAGNSGWCSTGEETLRRALGTVIVLMSVAGSNALNNRLDSDIDRLMGRTRLREIPSGRISNRSAERFGISFLAVSVVLASLSEFYFPILLAVGLSSYLFLYTLILKRHSVLSVLATGPAVASPVWIGWVIGRGYLDLAGLLTGLLVMVWGPLHLWSLATVFSEDYRSASVPMLPVVVGVKRSRLYLLALALVLSTASLSLYFLKCYGVVYLAGMVLMNSLLLTISITSITRPSGRKNWILYKFSAPYMVVTLLFAAVDRISV